MKTKSARDLVEFWGEFDIRDQEPPYVHPDDENLLKPAPESCLTFKDFVQSPRFGDDKDKEFHFSLIPVPYAGDLAKADVFVLMLNPGFHPVDYFAEYCCPKFRKTLEKNLRQEFDDTNFPFHYLNPEFCWHGGFVYWEKKLHQIIRNFADKKHDGNYENALAEISQRFAVIQLVPYHSKSFKGNKTNRNLESVRVAKEWVKSNLVTRAMKGEITIVVTRKVEEWGVRELRGKKNIICYTERGKARRADLSLKSRGGKAIFRQLLPGVAIATSITASVKKASKTIFGLDQVITLLVNENPKRKGSASRERFALYKNGMTVKSALKKGILREDLRWDTKHRFIEIE